MQRQVIRDNGKENNMKVKIKISSGKTLEIEGKILEKREIFGRKEALIDGKLSKPIWVTIPKK